MYKKIILLSRTSPDRLSGRYGMFAPKRHKKWYRWFTRGAPSLLCLGLILAGCNLNLAGLNNQQAKDGNQASVNQPIITPSPPEITLIFGGDVMLSRHVGTIMRRQGNWLGAWEKIATDFKSADLAFVNLESPFSDKGAPVTEGMVFKTEPEAIDGLKAAGLDVVSLANNHFQNAGRYGMQYTFDYLKENKIDYIGADETFDLAHQGRVLEIKGTKFGFLAYTYDLAGAPATSGLTINGLDEDQLIKDLAALKERSDVIIVSMHAGTEYAKQANKKQETFAQTAIDNGASLVIGHHPHVIENSEQYKDGVIFYSLGNLIFDQGWSEATQQGLVARITVQDDKITKAETAEVKIDNLYQPRWATDWQEIDF